MYDLVKDGDKLKIKIKRPYMRKSLYVGYIYNYCYHVDSRDNRYKTSGFVYLGIDKSILESSLSFHNISMEYNGQKIMTTRKYFTRNCQPFNLNNARNILFLRLDKFGLESAKDADIEAEVEQMDIFEVAQADLKEKNSKRLEIFLRSQAKREVKI